MPFPANALEAALVGARAGSVDADQLLSELAGNPLWVPLPGGADAPGQARLPVLVLDDRPYVAAYTSAEQYARGAGDQAHMELTGRELAGIMSDELGLAVNPGAEHGLPVHADGVRVIRGGRRTVPAGARMRLGQPAAEPAELLAALSGAFAEVPAVREARRCLAQVGDAAPALLIGVHPDRTISTWQPDCVAAVRAAVAGSPVPYAVETVFLDDRNDPVTRWMLEHTDPFYAQPSS
jgi:hypothetical protein